MKVFNELKIKLDDRYLTLKERRRAYDGAIEALLNNNAEYLRELNALGALKFKLAKAEYFSDNKTSSALKKEVDEQNIKVAKIKDNILKFNKISKYEYACDACKDTGFINGKPCKCRNKYLSEIILRSAGIDEKDLSEYLFNSPEQLKKYYEKFKEYPVKFPNLDTLNFIFYGAPGTGKTYLSKAVANAVLNNGNIVIYLTATELNNVFLKMHTGALDKTFAFDSLTNCDLLVIDDLGTEPIYNNVTVEYTVALISNRIDNKKPFIITTNLNTDEIKERYTDRLSSRLNDKQSTRFLKFDGKDLRTAPPQN